MLNNAKVPLLGFAAFSGTGKTTLLTKLLPLLTERGIRVGMIKHAHHKFDIDYPGKDSYELRKAGASQMLIASRTRWAFITEQDGEHDPDLNDLLSQLDHTKLDLILVEGFKHEVFPKIELHRAGLGHSYLYPQDKSIIALASDEDPQQENHPPLLDINQPEQVLKFILDNVLSVDQNH
jgi:molybdopterin-guanine dinucleotide biosynthesis protein B